ncbi:hypothetical protein DMB66_47475 [Actinoplanes sp. ATCC 53533]|nr:hypothetical protein DMB66_47475 [Actinoplanes sp. ATCC 53533]
MHGLTTTACEAEVAAFTPDPDDPDTLAEPRRLALGYLSVYDRLQAGEAPADISGGLTVDSREPVWRMPAGEPVDRHPQQLHAGDIIAGIWNRGPSGRYLCQSFAGHVKHIGEVHDRGQYGRWVHLTPRQRQRA